METKKCTSCGEVKPVTDFHWHYKDKGIRRHACKICRSNLEKERQRQPSYKIKRREYLLNKHYALSTEEYESRAKYQNYGCAICKEKCKSGKLLAVDHDHKTEKVRELLCGRCNVGLGSFRDRPDLLSKAIEYLEKHSG
jgi:hypothetical protein